MKKSGNFLAIAKVATDKVATALIEGTYNVEELDVKPAQVKPRAIPAYAYLKCSDDVQIAVSRLFRPLFDTDSKAVLPVITGLGDSNSAGAKVQMLVDAASATVKVTKNPDTLLRSIFVDGKMVAATDEWAGPKLTFKGIVYKAEEATLYNLDFVVA